MMDDPVLYGEHLQSAMASREDAIRNLVKSTRESSELTKMLFPGITEE